ncbi:DNA polymerase III subunit psi [Methylophaga sp.]|uniref:DNA polymerase III subunit psi n=1 Tax=Methylophaga sp. TaxID=2024840 RepID=UPI003F6A1773
MPLSEYQHRTLSELGIPVWQLRTRSVKEPTPQTDEQQATGTQNVDLSHPVWIVMVSTRLDNEEQRLLQSMLKAINLSTQSVTMLDHQQIDKIADAAKEDKAVLMLGHIDGINAPTAFDVSQPTLITDTANSHWIATYSLSDMLQDSRKKATVWQALKLLKTLYN